MRVTHFHKVIEPRSMSAKNDRTATFYKLGFIKAIQRNTVFQVNFGALSVKGRAESNDVGECKAMFAQCSQIQWRAFNVR